ncbi:sensor histidine kinase [Miniphocaeibacter halophilus]|uniref:HAMP domain-containing histidine kinase n=1 Tax=Miniphocaeibacter halophilus TaxID=2931922 RepID=A0AC61MYC6_9FIRM|nr:HAMP domain-containing sensor histidine kinase [Miniphocaeibacter halophilus]QQK08238.1 HAMP domain-containing histidine kinase [Miniphocaeibacter halophilus]
MKNNVSAKRLSLYFGIVLLIFSLIIGFIFFGIYKNQTIELQENLLIERAETIAENISTLDLGKGQMGGYGMYLKSINSIAGADAWVVDENLNVITSHSQMHNNTHSHENANGTGRMNRRNTENNEEDNLVEENIYDTEINLPENAEKIIKEALSGKVEVSEVFSDILGEQTITVGVPILANNSDNNQVVLLHSPVTGIEDAVKQGTKALLISLGIGLLIAILLSIYLSKVFTGPILLKEAEDIIKLENDRKNFLAQIAHELKTPITVMKSTLENFNIKENPTVEELQEYNSQVLGEVNSLQRLVGDLLDLTKLESPDFSIEISEIYLTDLIDDIIRSSRKLALGKNIKIIQENIPNIVINGDYGRLRQMFLIIIDNAIKFSKENSQIEIKGEKNKILICDNGVGIKEKDLKLVFNRFYKDNSEKNIKGTGLGLSIAKEIAEKHSSQLTVESQYKKGTCFIFNYEKILK